MYRFHWGMVLGAAPVREEDKQVLGWGVAGADPPCGSTCSIVSSGVGMLDQRYWNSHMGARHGHPTSANHWVRASSMREGLTQPQLPCPAPNCQRKIEL